MKVWFLVLGLWVVSCSKSENNPPMQCVPLPGMKKNLAVMMTRGTTSEVRFLNLESGQWLSRVVPIHYDAVFKKGSASDKVVVLNRMGRDTFQQISTNAGTPDIHFSLGGGNVQDLIWSSKDEFWVSYFTHSKIRRWSLTGKDLGVAVEFNGFTEPYSMLKLDGKVFVMFQNLVNYEAVKPATLGIWDGRVKEVYELSGKNPLAPMKVKDGFIYAAFSGKLENLVKDPNEYLDGSFGRLDSGRRWSNFITEKELNTDILDFEILNEQSYIFLLGSKKTQVVSYSLREGVKPMLKSEGYTYRKILVDDEKKWLVVADSEPTKPKLHFWRLDTMKEHVVCDLNTMPPVDLFILD